MSNLLSCRSCPPSLLWENLFHSSEAVLTRINCGSLGEGGSLREGADAYVREPDRPAAQVEREPEPGEYGKGED